MKLADLKTIDVTTLVWFDKTYGNSYFAQEITLNYGMSDSEVFKNPFQYGYSSFDHEAMEFLIKKVFTDEMKDLKPYDLFKLCEDNNIVIRTNTYKNCKKRELMNI